MSVCESATKNLASSHFAAPNLPFGLLENPDFFLGIRLPASCVARVAEQPHNCQFALNANKPGIVPAVSESRFQRLERLFDEASSMGSAERDSFLTDACIDDPELADEVRELLRHDATENDSLKDAVRSAAEGVVAESPDHRAGTRLGAWELVSHISDGGMGSVYRARRADGAFEQQTAVKLLNPAMLGEQAIRRLEAERQILANLNHPNIANLLDGGSGEDGVPYLVLEYVDGEPIDRYCETHGLSTRKRLHLFRKVCAAVEYAHRNLVVHRDIKPSNILVQADGEPKLLDFGISKLLGDEDPALTRVDQRLFTPAYASPEQITGGTITTATDVYALGVLLYQILAGRLPHTLPPGETEVAGGIAARILSEDPPAPSEAVTLVDSERRSLQPPTVTAAQLRRELAGELDNIVMMAIRREPERRYASVRALSLDVERYLNDRPIEARPDSLGYRTAKFLKRRRGPLVAATAMVVVLLGQSAFFIQRVIEERDTAEAERARAENVVVFMEELLQGADYYNLQGQEVTIEAILERGAARIDTELADQPLAQARLMQTIAETYLTLHRGSEARLLVDKVIALRREYLGPYHPDTLEARRFHATIIAPSEPTKALSLLQEIVTLQREHLGPDHLETALTLREIGIRQERLGNPSAALETHREVLRLLSSLPPDHPKYYLRGDTLNSIGNTFTDLSRFDAAIEAFEEASRLYEEIDFPYSTSRISAISNLGGVLGDAGRPAEAVTYLLRAMELTKTRMGTENESYEIQAVKLARNYMRLGMLEEAETYAMIGLETAGKTWGTDHQYYAYNLVNVARFHQRAEDHAAALETFAQANSIFREAYGDYHRWLAESEVYEAVSLIAVGRAADAVAQLEAVRARMLADPDHKRIMEATARSVQGLALAQLGEWETAEPLLQRAASDLTDLMGEDNEYTQAANDRLTQAKNLIRK